MVLKGIRRKLLTVPIRGSNGSQRDQEEVADDTNQRF